MILNGGGQMVATRSPGVGEAGIGKAGQVQGQQASRPTMLPLSVSYQHQHQQQHHHHHSSRGQPQGQHLAAMNGVMSPASTSSTNSNPSAAASFFAR